MTNSTALIVLNMQKLYTAGESDLFVALAADMLQTMNEKISNLRNLGVKIIFIKSIQKDNTEGFDTLLYKRIDRMPKKGESEADFDESLAISDSDLIFEKNASSAFFGTSLYETLMKLEIKNVIVSGLTTEYDVRATATDSMSHHIMSYIAQDMVAAKTKELSDIHLDELTKYTAKALSYDEILQRIKAGQL